MSLKVTEKRKTINKPFLWVITALFAAMLSCTSDPEISISNGDPNQGITKVESGGQQQVLSGSEDVKKEENSKISDEPKVNQVTAVEWGTEAQPKSPEELATAEKKSKEMIDAGVISGDTQGAELKYPTLYYQGNGTYSCQGRINPSNSKVISQLSLTHLDSKLVDAKASHPRDSVESRINEELEASLDSAIYRRVTSAERDQWKKQGYDLADNFAIFATSVEKPKAGQIYNFDQPLPIGFWPATLSRYDDLLKGPRTWTAKVTGTKSFTATITLSHISTQGDKVVLRLSTTIPEDRNRSIYEVFPIPRESIYTIDTKLLHVESSKNTNWFFGDNCDNRPEEIVMTYKLCQKVSGAKTDTYSCQP